MSDSSALPHLRDVIRAHGLDARKALGQHFLLDMNLLRRIVRVARIAHDSTVYEVGPGPGGLTRALLESGARVVAVEADARCVEALQYLRNAFPDRLRVIHGNALETAEADFVPRNAVVVSNLPYNVSTVLLVKWLTAEPAPFAEMTLMFQKEVAERLIATPGRKAYGRISVLAQWRCVVRREFDIPASSFVPPPKVASTLVRLTTRSSPIPVPVAALERVTAAAFGQRRKMLRASLRSILPDPVSTLKYIDISPTARAEELAVSDFCAIARVLNGT